MDAQAARVPEPGDIDTDRRRPGWLKAAERKLSLREIGSRLWTALAPQRMRLVGIAAVASATASFEASTLLVVATLVEVLSMQGQQAKQVELPFVHQFVALVPSQLFALAVACVCGRALLQVVSSTSSARMQIRYEAAQRDQLFALFVNADWEQQASARAGELQTLLTTSITLARKTLGAVSNALVAMANVAVLLAVACAVHAPTVLVMGATALFLFLVVRPLSQRARKLAFGKAELNIEYAGRVNDAVVLARELRTFGVGETFKALVGKLAWRSADYSVRAQLLEALVPAAYQNVAFLVLVGGLFVAWVVGYTAFASLGVAVVLLLRALTHGQALQAVYHAVVESMPYLDQLDAFSVRHGAKQRVAGDAALQRIDTLALRAVSFSYRADTPTLSEVSFHVARGEALGVVGPSGSGKSTLVQILLRLRAPDHGAFEVNGMDAARFTDDTWTRRVAYVPQDAQLLDDTVRENVRFLRSDISDAAVISACKLAQIHGEIEALPRGYDSFVGERGGALSGGQRQRLCIARALVGAPDLLVLDEPTSALDVHSEARLQQALEGLRGQLSMVIVAHRLSTLSLCDKLLVLRAGRVDAFGTPESVRRDSAYFASAMSLASAPVGPAP